MIIMETAWVGLIPDPKPIYPSQTVAVSIFFSYCCEGESEDVMEPTEEELGLSKKKIQELAELGADTKISDLDFSTVEERKRFLYGQLSLKLSSTSEMLEWRDDITYDHHSDSGNRSPKNVTKNLCYMRQEITDVEKLIAELPDEGPIHEAKIILAQIRREIQLGQAVCQTAQSKGDWKQVVNGGIKAVRRAYNATYKEISELAAELEVKHDKMLKGDDIEQTGEQDKGDAEKSDPNKQSERIKTTQQTANGEKNNYGRAEQAASVCEVDPETKALQFLTDKLKNDKSPTRKEIADAAGVSVRTLYRKLEGDFPEWWSLHVLLTDAESPDESRIPKGEVTYSEEGQRDIEAFSDEVD